MFMSAEEREERVQSLVRQAWLLIRGDEKEKSGNLEKAIHLYTQALEIEPDCISALVGRCTTRWKVGLKDEAEKDALRLLDLPAKDEDYYLVAEVFDGVKLREFIGQVLPKMSEDSPFRAELFERSKSL